MVKYAIVLGLAVAGLVALWGGSHLISAQEAEKAPVPLEKAFPASSKCKRCHERAYVEWEKSPLSRSIHSPAFRVALDRYVAFAKATNKSFCFQCHAPHILEFEEQTPMFISEVRSGDPQIDGVGCAQCHLITDLNKGDHGVIPEFTLGKTVYGPYSNYVENLAHGSMGLEVYRKSEFCLACHQTVPVVAQLDKHTDMIGAWKQTKAAKDGKECQSCHMPNQFGESANGERKRQVADHSFPGRTGNMREEAAKLDVATKVEDSQSTVTVTVQSLVPHNLPSAHPGWARVVLDLTIKGKNLRKVYGEQRYYGRTYINAQDEKTVFDFEATDIMENTVLQPEETRKEVFTFPTPKDAPSFDVEVTLSYAPISGPEKFLKRVQAESSQGPNDPVFQSIPIAKKAVNIPLK